VLQTGFELDAANRRKCYHGIQEGADGFALHFSALTGPMALCDISWMGLNTSLKYASSAKHLWLSKAACESIFILQYTREVHPILFWPSAMPLRPPIASQEHGRKWPIRLERIPHLWLHSTG
jgi:hypothetical protein